MTAAICAACKVHIYGLSYASSGMIDGNGWQQSMQVWVQHS
jgi:hypothetical protein